MGLAWFALPGILSLCYLTHLAGPDAADLTVAGGKLSFRLFEFLLLLGLIAIDVLWRHELFTKPEDVAQHQRGAVSAQHGVGAGLDAVHQDEHAVV